MSQEASPLPSPLLRPLTPRQAERRERILSSTITLLGIHGYDAVTMSMIARESGTAEKTLYNNFGTKDRLVAVAARERSASVFALAATRQPAQGWPRMREFARTAAEVTLEAPVLSRSLARLLLDHAELVGLHDVYETQVGAMLAAIATDGLIGADAPVDLLVRTIRLAVVSAVLFWARGQVADAEIEACIIGRCAEILLPHATAAGQETFRDQALKASALMASMPPPVINYSAL